MPDPAPPLWELVTDLDACEPLLLTVADKRVLVLDALNGDAGPLERLNVHKGLVDMWVLLHHVRGDVQREPFRASDMWRGFGKG